MALNKDQTVIVLSSLVAGSPVGGSVTTRVLIEAGFDAQHVPSVIFGRHPGLGAPGGGAVPDDVFAGALDGLNATNPQPRAILTGYFASTEQVISAAEFIRSIRQSDPDVLVVVDPILGDGVPDASDNGLYIPRSVATSIRDHLVPLADLITPNAYEFSWLTGAPVINENAAQKSVAAWPSNIVVTSVPGSNQHLVTIGKNSSGVMRHTAQHRAGVDHGVGDLFAGLMLRSILSGRSFKASLLEAHQGVQDSLVPLQNRDSDH